MPEQAQNFTWHGDAFLKEVQAAERFALRAFAGAVVRRIRQNLNRPGTPEKKTTKETLGKAFRNLGHLLSFRPGPFGSVLGTTREAVGLRRSRARNVVQQEKTAKRLLSEPHKKDNIFVDPPGGMPRVRSGRLRDSAGQADEGDSVIVGTGKTYSKIHEFGGLAGKGRKTVIPPRPYVKRSFGEATPEGLALFEAEFTRRMGGVG